MIDRVEFSNYKILRNTVLPLGRFTLLVGPNGSGKSTAFQALEAMKNPTQVTFKDIASADIRNADIDNQRVTVQIGWKSPANVTAKTVWVPSGFAARGAVFLGSAPVAVNDNLVTTLGRFLAGIRIYRLNATTIAAAVGLQPVMELAHDGGSLAGVLDRLRDQFPERFEALTEEFTRCLPEFNRILFDTPRSGHRSLNLRTRRGGHLIAASQVSDGTLLVLAVLTLAYLPEPPTLVGLEEPEHGIHPRLLSNVRDALHRLSNPEEFNESRPAVQVVATTHSPYLLDLFKDHPEEVVISQKVGNEAKFERLSDRKDIEEILGGAPLGEVWYSGVLGGVPSEK